MKKYNILVFPCGSEIGLDIHSSVKYSTYFNLIGASSVADHGQFIYEQYIPNVPFVTDEAFIPSLQKIVQEYKIDAIYPTMDTVIACIKTHESELGCKIIASPLKTTEICLSKKMTYDLLNGIIRIPRIYNPGDIPTTEFPVFAKPIVGYSAKGTMKLDNQEEVNAFLKNKTDLLVVEYLPGDEFTVDCFTDRYGNLLYCSARKRNRINNGISVNTFFVENQNSFQSIASIINAHIQFQGAWFFQVKYDRHGELCLLEIASRLGGSSLLSRSVGVNFALLSLFDAFGYDVSILQNDYSVELDRALGSRYRTNLQFDSVYCDYDDCLLLNKNEINLDLVRFLYKCVNEKKKIYLLSKHEGSDLHEELRKFRLEHIFDEVIHIPRDAHKSDYILSACPIFIDDSTSERMRVKKKLDIPVFSPDMIDVLM